MAKIGIVGGAGPWGTAKLYSKLHRKTVELGLSARPEIVIESLPIPYAIESSTITGERAVIKLNVLTASCLQHLITAGATTILIPCNTLHGLIRSLPETEGVEIVDLIATTCKAIGQTDVKTVGLLATNATRRHGLYDQHLNKFGVSVVHISEATQQHIDAIIDRMLLDPTRQLNERERRALASACDELAALNAEKIIIGCTDLPCPEGNTDIIDPLDSLVDFVFLNTVHAE